MKLRNVYFYSCTKSISVIQVYHVIVDDWLIGDAELVVSGFCFSHMFAKWKNILSDVIVLQRTDSENIC
jgi:hypothetical protein